MKILLVNNRYPPPVLAGAERSVQLLAQGLMADGHDVAVACLAEARGTREDGGVRVHEMAAPGVAALSRPSARVGLVGLPKHLNDRNVTAQLREIVAAERPAVMHTSS